MNDGNLTPDKVTQELFIHVRMWNRWNQPGQVETARYGENHTEEEQEVQKESKNMSDFNQIKKI